MLDIAAGILLAGKIIGTVLLGIIIAVAQGADHANAAPGVIIAVIGILAGLALIVCRLIGWP